MNRSLKRLLPALLALPLLFWIAGCDSSDGSDNQAPTASFSSSQNDLTVEFDASPSGDPDGSIASYEWNFGDGSDTETGQTVSHTYASEGDYDVTLTVTDEEGTSNDDQQTFSVSSDSQPVVAPYDTSGSTITVAATEDRQGDPLGVGIVQGDGSRQEEVTWSSDFTYLLDGNVYVNGGQTLTIEPGTVIKGITEPTTGDQASALIVARDGMIEADGEANNPIVFTAENDDVSDPSDLGPTDRQLWGGVIINGRAPNNVGGGTNFIEGLPQEDPRNVYGGSDPDDDSGTFRYVSIRHGGALFGRDNEINGLTMGSVGRGTTIEYVEVYANKDDGFEWFGGTVNTKHLVSAFVGDDGFDYDEGWTGENQFWMLLHNDDEAGTGGEHDGGANPETGEPFAIPTIANVTYIGSGADANVTSNDFALTIDDNAGGKYYNSIFGDFAGAGVTVEDLSSGADSRQRLEEGDLVLDSNIWYDFGDINGVGIDEFSDVFVTDGEGNRQQYVIDAFADINHLGVDPQLGGISRTADGGLDPLPASDGAAFSRDRADVPNADGFFEDVDYIGAFGDENWAEGWTTLSQNGFFN
jgi:PKD repeat protein